MMLIIDKPAGIAVHASGRTDNHLGLYLEAWRFGLPQKPELAHRLDRDTSGCLVLGRHHKALRRLGMLFTNGYVEKTYWAVVVGAPNEEAGVIDAPLLKAGPAWNWRMRVDAAGQASVTEWRVLGRGGRLSWIECKPKTGRTHQLRVHLASIGLPIAGDYIYGKGTADRAAERLQLHARAVSVPLYYPKKPAVTAVAPVPPHMMEALAQCGWRGDEEPAATEAPATDSV